MIIDAHAHIFPDKIAQRAVKGISDFYDLPMRNEGTVDDLIERGSRAGVDKFIVQSVATVPEQVESINKFICDSVNRHSDRLIGFGAIYPGYGNVKDEINNIISSGLRGVKLHPDFQHFYIDSPEAYQIYEEVEGKLPVLMHMGDSRYDYSAPERLLKVLSQFPGLTIIGAHFAGWSLWDESTELLKDQDMYVDCSSSLYAMSSEHAEKLIREFGVDKVLWGTDYPMWTAEEELELFNKINLTDEEREKILSGNALRVLGESGK